MSGESQILLARDTYRVSQRRNVTTAVNSHIYTAACMVVIGKYNSDCLACEDIAIWHAGILLWNG